MFIKCAIKTMFKFNKCCQNCVIDCYSDGLNNYTKSLTVFGSQKALKWNANVDQKC